MLFQHVILRRESDGSNMNFSYLRVDIILFRIGSNSIMEMAQKIFEKRAGHKKNCNYFEN